MSSVFRSCYVKEWDPVFSKDRWFKDDQFRSYVDRKRELGEAGEGIELFLKDDQGFGLNGKVEELKAFAATVSLEDLKYGVGSAGQRLGALLDERSLISGTREHRNYPLTATQLYQRRKTSRIASEDTPDSLPDFDRRLIYINSWDASYMLALTETAADHEVPLLRDAIWNHYNRQTSLKVRIPTKGFKIFQLEFHLKYWVFGPSSLANQTDQRDAAGYSMKWTNISFLEIQTPKEPVGQEHGMFEAHFSFVICGSHERRWTAYAFDDTEFDGEDLYEKIFPHNGFHSDPIVSDGDTDAELPIWDAREYFLRTVSSRVASAADSWDELLRRIEHSIQKYRVRHPSTLSHLNSRKRDRGETAKTFDWTQQTIELVNKLRKTLSETNKLWQHFNSHNGDIGYFESSSESSFSGTVRNRIKLLCEINETFQRLEELERTLEYLSASCKDSENALRLRLTLESSEATKASGAISDFTTFVLLPIAVAAACLQFSPTMVPLPPGPAVIILTAVFIVTIKTLHAIFGALPGIAWWWRLIKITWWRLIKTQVNAVKVEAMKVEDVESGLSVSALGNTMLKHTGDIDITPAAKLEHKGLSSPFARYKDKLDSIYGVSDSEPTRGKSLLEVALSKCGANNPRGRCTITYELTWELPSYLKKFFPAKQPLGSILTLTGGTFDAYGSSCKGYLDEMFPGIGPCVLECLEKMLLDSEAAPYQESTLQELPPDAGIDEIVWSCTIPNSSDGDIASISSASCIVNANNTAHIQVALVLSWLCAALRCSNNSGLSLSSILVGGETTDEGRKISIKTAPLETVVSNGACWHGGFPRGAIARNFPIRRRKSSGRGLEIPFADMALICGSLGFVEYKNGLVVDGLNSILIPRKRLPEDDAFQWHFESKIREEGRVAYASDVLEAIEIEPWYNGTSPVLPDELYTKRCFLAWAERGIVMVGTEEHFNSTTIGESHANVSASMKHVLAYGLNLGGNVSQLTFGLTINLTPTSIPAFFKPSVSNGMRDILAIESTPNKGKNFVLVYDTDAKIAWYLPQACVVLYMTHYYLSEQRLELIDARNQEISLEFPKQDSDTDIGSAAASILSKSLCCRTRRRLISSSTPADKDNILGETPSSPTTTTIYEYDHFKNTVERLWYLLDTAGSTSKMNRSQYIKCSESPPYGIHGIDFKELLAAKGPGEVTSIRYVKIDQPWSYLTNDLSTVIFCKNFGQAIIPAPEGLCCAWLRVPQKKDFLAMTGQTIQYFLRKNKSGLSKELKWFPKKPLIRGHCQLGLSSVIHTQLLTGKIGASLAKIKDKIGRTILKSEGDLSNIELVVEIDPQSCLLFSAQPGKECTNPAVDPGVKDVLRLADRTEAPIFLAQEYAIRSKLLGLQNQRNSDLAPVGYGTMSLNHSESSQQRQACQANSQ